jgi:hypothetical protein
MRTSVRGLPALLTDTERATPTMARGALSAFVCTCGCAESGGDCSCWMRCSGDGASRGADDGCELSAESLVTVGCAFESARLRVETGVEVQFRGHARGCPPDDEGDGVGIGVETGSGGRGHGEFLHGQIHRGAGFERWDNVGSSRFPDKEFLGLVPVGFSAGECLVKRRPFCF